MTHITHRAGVAATLFSFSRVLMAVSLGTWVWLGAVQATFALKTKTGFAEPTRQSKTPAKHSPMS